jgi:hypothetical protein
MPTRSAYTFHLKPQKDTASIANNLVSLGKRNFEIEASTEGFTPPALFDDSIESFSPLLTLRGNVSLAHVPSFDHTSRHYCRSRSLDRSLRGAGFAQQVLCICLPQKIETAQNRSIGFNGINFERIPSNQSLINESLIQKARGHSSYGTDDLATAGP